MEELGDAVWELDTASQTLIFTRIVRTTAGIEGLVVSSAIHHVTLEIVRPLKMMSIFLLVINSILSNM